MKNIILLFTVACVVWLTGCASNEHQHEQPVVLQPPTDWQKLYIEQQSRNAAKEEANRAIKAAEESYFRQLQIRNIEQENAFREWQRNTGARMHPPARP